MAAGNSLIRTIPFILIMVLLCPFTYGRIIYVDDDAAGANVGSNWADAINSLQDALLLAYFYEKPVEIRVAQGIYTPDKGIGIMPADREASFQLIDGVTIKGGYAGLSHRSPEDLRDIALYETILSGDLMQNDGPDSAGLDDNSYHVVTCYETDQTAVLDGITISAGGNSSLAGRAGRVGGSEDDFGGGMYNNYGSPMLINCTFADNRGRFGAGVYNDSGSPSFFNCSFNGNAADDSGGAMYNNRGNPRYLNCTFTGNSANSEGGGMYNDSSEPVITNCSFSENTGDNGGGIYNYLGTSMLADCVFVGNSVTRSGGAVCIDGSTTTFLNCKFKENSANSDGGGIFYDGGFPRKVNLTNCIFSRNSARNGGAIAYGRGFIFGGYIEAEAIDESSYSIFLQNCTFNDNFADNDGGGIYYLASDEGYFSRQLKIVNCILWDDAPEELSYPGESLFWDYGETVVVLYSNVQGGFPGKGNIDMDPVFADPNNDDYHLKSTAGRRTSASSVEPDPTSQSWVIDQTSSPCIDAGDPNISVGLERFPNGGRINMGAFGGTPEASLSPPILPTLYSQAYNPYPLDGATRIDNNVTLTWTAGLNAAFHDVYLGIDRNVVANADTTSAVYRGRQTVTSYTPPEDYIRDIGYYYWRIDEVNSKGKIIKGVVWSFTTGTSSPAKGRACFTGDTPVWVDGKLVPISKTAAAQLVSGIAGQNKIDTVQVHNGTFTCYDVLLESGKTITVAENHYFMTESGQWLSLHDLKSGMKLKTSKGSIRIKNITKKPEPYFGKVYNLKIEDSDRYLIGEDAIIVRDY